MTKMKYTKDNPLKVVTLFSGYDSQCLALKRLKQHYPMFDYELVAWCEFDPESKSPVAKQPAVVAHNALFPQYADRNLGDITKVNENDVPNCDLITWSFPCCLAGTFVKTVNGYKRIENVIVGDLVQTHRNRYKSVTKTMQRQVPMYYLVKGTGFSLRLTAEHPLYVLRDGQQQWVKVEDLQKTDKVSYNIPQTARQSNLTNTQLWLLGRYVADGWIDVTKHNSVEFSVGDTKEAEFLEHISNSNYKFKKVSKNGCSEYRLAHKDFQSLCKEFGNGAKNKKLPEWVLQLPNEQILIFLDGYFSGDGHVRYRGGSKVQMFATTSKELFLGIQLLLLKVYSKVCSLSIREDKRKQTFNDTYNGQFVITKSPFQTTIRDKVFVPIKEITKVNESVVVYNLSIEDDESYTCDNVISHNCTDISQAGRQEGLTADSGTRSSLAWEAIRIFKAKRPKFLLMENVPNLVSQKFIKDFYDIFYALEKIGYANFPHLLNAKHYGVAQNRERIFLVSIRIDDENNMPRYHFPKPFKLVKRLKDYLEENVSEEYYLSDERLEEFFEKDNGDATISQHQWGLVNNMEKESMRALCATDYKQPPLVFNE